MVSKLDRNETGLLVITNVVKESPEVLTIALTGNDKDTILKHQVRLHWCAETCKGIYFWFESRVLQYDVV